MQRKSCTTLAALAALAAALPAGATEPPVEWGPRQGLWEATLTGTGSNDKDFDVGSFGVSGSIGYYPLDWLQVFGRQTGSFVEPDDGESSWAGISRVGVDFLIPLHERFYPYVGGNVGFVYGTDIAEAGTVGPEAGIRWYALPSTFLFFQTEYQVFFLEDDDVDSGFDNGQFVYSVGVGFHFGGGDR